MRLPRLRFTVRRLMVAVAIVAASMALLAGFPEWAERRRSRIAAIGFRYASSYSELSRQHPPADPRRLGYYDAMRKKYYHAAQRPWLPVMPDPPEPK